MLSSAFLYLLQVTAYTGGAWLIYRLLLRNRPLHGWNRGFLLLSAMVPLVLPFGHLSFLHTALPTAQIIHLPSLTVSEAAMPHGGIRYELIASAAYLAVCGGLLLRWLLQYVRMGRALRRGIPGRQQGCLTLHSTGIGPGTFGRAIFFPGEGTDGVILRHELAHIHLGHRYDLALTGLLQCLIWPNVFLHRVVRELRMVHEFQADAAACREDLPAYAHQLLSHIFGTPAFSLAPAFFHQPIKRRIMMLQQSGRRTRRMPLMMATLGLALLCSAVTLWAQSGPKRAEDPALASGAGNTANSVAADRMPEFDGDINAYISGNLKYPPEALKANKQGTVVLKLQVSDQGIVGPVEISRTSYVPVLDEEALRVANTIPRLKPAIKNGKPVPAAYYLPIQFRRTALFLPAARVMPAGDGC